MVLFRSLFLSFAICAFLTYCIIIIYDDQELNSQHQGTVENIHEHVETVLINERHNTAKHSKESLNNTKNIFYRLCIRYVAYPFVKILRRSPPKTYHELKLPHFYFIKNELAIDEPYHLAHLWNKYVAGVMFWHCFQN